MKFVTLLIVGTLCFSVTVSAHAKQWSESREIKRISDLIFNNECSRKIDSLLSWNEGEAFPSLGIGHFIWYPEGYEGPFTESFPLLLEFIEKEGVVLPVFITQSPHRHAPWKKRKQFLDAKERGELAELQEFLIETQYLQAAFLVERFKKSILLIFQCAPEQQEELYQKIAWLLEAEAGLYPLIDYVNFNGEGISGTERYNGLGWGLLQVLEEMRIPDNSSDPVREFMLAAERILERRVANSPQERNEKRWLQGWKNRIATYCSTVYDEEGITSDGSLRTDLIAALSETKMLVQGTNTNYRDIDPSHILFHHETIK